MARPRGPTFSLPVDPESDAASHQKTFKITRSPTTFVSSPPSHPVNQLSLLGGVSSNERNSEVGQNALWSDDDVASLSARGSRPRRELEKTFARFAHRRGSSPRVGRVVDARASCSRPGHARLRAETGFSAKRRDGRGRSATSRPLKVRSTREESIDSSSRTQDPRGRQRKISRRRAAPTVRGTTPSGQLVVRVFRCLEPLCTYVRMPELVDR